MKLVRKDIGIACLGFCLAVAAVCLGLTISVWKNAKVPSAGKALLTIGMLIGFSALILTLITAVAGRRKDVGNVWRFGLGTRPTEEALVSLWSWSRITLAAWAAQIFVALAIFLYMWHLDR